MLGENLMERYAYNAGNVTGMIDVVDIKGSRGNFILKFAIRFSFYCVRISLSRIFKQFVSLSSNKKLCLRVRFDTRIITIEETLKVYLLVAPSC